MTALATQTTFNEYSNWFERAVPAYDQAGQPTFLDANGELIAGIYLDMPNDVYHSLNALSSSGLKSFIESPALYYRDYIQGTIRKRTTAFRRTMDAGTYGHELVLEPQGFYDRYFRDPVQADWPDALSTTEQIETALVEAGLPAKEGKAEKLVRLQRLSPTLDVSALKTIADIDEQLTQLGASKTESKLDKAIRLFQVAPHIDVFDYRVEKIRAAQGAKVETTDPETGEVTVTYGGKKPIDGVVWDDAHRVQKSVLKHMEAKTYISNGLPEVAIIARCKVTNMWLKVKFDWLRFDDKAVDLKTSGQSVKPEDFRRQIMKLHYNIQQVFYTYVASLADIVINEFIFVAVEYGTKDVCQPYKLSNYKVSKSKIEMVNALNEFLECKETGNWYGYVKEDCTIELVF